MSAQTVPISASHAQQNKNETWFDAFNFLPGQDANIRWLSRPNQHPFQDTMTRDSEKFRITFDVENFQPDQIKIYIMNGQLTISGVYEERSEGRYMQKQFEKSFDIPEKADVDSMAAYITPAHMLVVEIPLTSNPQALAKKMDHLSIEGNTSNQRRLSFSLDKFSRLANEGLGSQPNNTSTLATPGNHQVRRTSVTKITTTTTTSGSPGTSGVPTDLAQLLLGANNQMNINSTTSTSHQMERRASNSGAQQIRINEPQSGPPSTNTPTVMNSTDLAKLGIEIPQELLTVGGTITIQKRRVSVTRTADVNANQPVAPPPSPNKVDSQGTSSTSTTSKTTTSTSATNVSQNAPVPSNTSNATNSTGTRPPTTSSTGNQDRKSYTLEEFLQNKTWNPAIEEGPDGKKVLLLRLQMKPGTTIDHLRITLDGFVLRVEVNNSVTTAPNGQISEQSYHEVTLFPTCDVDQLRSVLKADGFLHIRVPIKL